MTLVATGLMFVFMVNVLLTGILLAIWTYIDATERASANAVQWAIVAAFLLPVVLYLLFRDRIGTRSGPMGQTERAIGTAYCGCLAGFLSAMISPPDPATAGLYALVFVPVGLVVGYVLVWRGKLVAVSEQFSL